MVKTVRQTATTRGAMPHGIKKVFAT